MIKAKSMTWNGKRFDVYAFRAATLIFGFGRRRVVKVYRTAEAASASDRKAKVGDINRNVYRKGASNR